MKAANLGRERWVYGLHALAGLLLGLPTLGLIADWLRGGARGLLALFGGVVRDGHLAVAAGHRRGVGGAFRLLAVDRRRPAAVVYGGMVCQCRLVSVGAVLAGGQH